MIEIYSLERWENWDQVVRSFDDHDIYWLSGYVRAFRLHGDGEPMLLYYEDGDLRGINVVMKRDIAHDKHFVGKIPEGEYFDLATPYGYGGWLFEGEEKEDSFDKFSEEYTSLCKDNKIVSEFVRFHPVLENASFINDRYYDTVLLGPTVAIELDDKEKIWERYSSKNRSHIRVAMKEGVSVKIDNSKEAFEQFMKIYETTMDHDDADSYYYFDRDFFESVRKDLEGSGTIFTAYLGDVAIASSIMLYSEKYMNYHLSGQLFEYRRYSGTSVILDEAAKWGCDKGFRWLHLGGGLGAKEGPLYEFKKAFYKKGEDKKFHIGRKIFDEERYNELLGMREGDLDEGFFPRYRA